MVRQPDGKGPAGARPGVCVAPQRGSPALLLAAHRRHARLVRTPCPGQSKLDIQHASGTTTVVANPKKVVVLDLTRLDTMAALGIDLAGVPESPMPKHLFRFSDKKYTRLLGTLFEPDFEAIHAAEPDLTVVGGC